MEQREFRLQELLSELGWGDIYITVVDGKLFQIPVQRIERPAKSGIRSEFMIDRPIRLKAA